jgi:hypothetical protein
MKMNTRQHSSRRRSSLRPKQAERRTYRSRLAVERLEERTVLSSFLTSFGGGGNDDTIAGHYAADPGGSAYVGGRFTSQPADFGRGASGDVLVNSAGGYDAYVAKFNSDGSLAWVHSLGGAGDEWTLRWVFAHEASGDYLYAAGTFTSPSISLESGITLTNAGGQDIWLAKFNAQDGTTIWAKSLGSVGSEYAQDMAVDGGNVYLAGQFENTVNFGGKTMTADPNASVNGFMWTLNADGNYVNAWQLSTSLESIVVEGNTAYVKGRYWGTVDFGDGVGRTPVGTNSIYVADYSTTGSLRWIQTTQLVGLNQGTIASDATSLYVPLTVTIPNDPSFDASILIETFDKQSGAPGWSKQVNGSSGDWASQAVMNPATGMLYVSGYTWSPSLDFNPGGSGGQLSNAGGSAVTTDSYVLKLDAASGSFQHVWQMGGTGNDFARIHYAAGTAGHETFLASGYFQGTAAFPTGTTLTSVSATGQNAYLMGFDEADPQVAMATTSVSKSGGNSGTTPFTFTVTRTGDTSASATVNYSTADGSAKAGTDYMAAAGTLTFAAGEASKTIIVTVNGKARTTSSFFSLWLTDAVTGEQIGVGRGIIQPPPVKFHVVDDSATKETFDYSADGQLMSSYSAGQLSVRGVASSPAGDKTYVLDQNGNVSIYNAAGMKIDVWHALGLGKVPDLQGVATDGVDCWIVDAKSDKVYRFAGAASGALDNYSPASSFSLASGNTNATDLVTDGQAIWVVDNGSKTDKVFKYTLSGSSLGSWTITSGGGSPTGITIDPTNVSNIWIVDNATDRVYQFNAAASRTSGTQSPTTSFALAAGNTNPQGIADPPPGTGTSAYDSALLAVIGDLDDLLGRTKKRV